MVGVGERLGHDGPGVLPPQVVLVHEQSHELGDGQNGVGVVELNGVGIGEAGEVVPVVGHVVVDDLLKGGRAEEVLLAHAQDLALVGGVVGVEDARDVRCALALDDRIGEALGIEGVVVELLQAFRPPQAQRVDVLRAVADDRHVIGDGAHDQVVVAHHPLRLFTADDEGIALLHPRIRVLGLETVGEELLEQAVTVEDAVSGHREIESCAGIEETGGEASKASVAQGGVGLLLEDVGEVLTEGAHRLLRIFDQTEVGQVVQERATHEELGGEIMLHPAGAVLLLGRMPIVRNGVDDGGGQALPHLHLSRCGGGVTRD